MAKNVPADNLVRIAPKYIPVINSLRGLASVTVCIFHLIWKPLNFLENTSLYENATYGKYGVQIFFVITGVVIPLTLINGKYNYRLFGTFIWKRIARIEPPYLFSILTGVLFILARNYFLSKTPHDIPTIKSLLLHIGYLVPFVKGENWFLDVYWTMAVEFQFYLIISLLFPVLTSDKLIIRSVSCFIVFGMALTFTSVDFVLVWLPVFMMGIIYVNYRSGEVKQTEFWLILTTSICMSFFLHHVIITVVAVSTLAVIHFYANHESTTGNFLGKISYSLYLMHMIFGAATVNFFIPYVHQLPGKLLVVLLGFIVSLISAYVFYLIIEKPFQELASKILLKPKAVVEKEVADSNWVLNKVHY